ncbi:sensor histidine kinase [Paenibacillus sp. RC67]|uniref:sensor histidine kinase n=1 Tax=Paenibacillus sp. RC67 TaxID=3039392 RepID=UPI0024AE17CB|nr:sensor histidine kinase [Paenibacillus sp. RC67]
MDTNTVKKTCKARLARPISLLEPLWSRWKTSFKWKLVSIFVLVVFANLLLIGIFTVRETSSKIQQDDMQFSSLILKQANLNLVRYLQEYERFLFTLGSSEQLQSWSNLSIGRKPESVVPFYVLESDYIKPFTNTHPELLSVMLYHVSGNQAYFTTDAGIRPGYTMGQEPWFNQINPMQKVTYLSDITSNYVDSALNPMRLPIVSIVKRVGFNGVTYIKIDIKPDLMQSILNEINIGKSGVGFIINSSGLIVAHPQRDKLLTPLDHSIRSRMKDTPGGSFIIPGSNEIVVYQSIEGTDWKSVIVIPYVEVAGSVVDIRRIIISTAAICMVLSVLFIIFVSSSITRRISKLKQFMKQTGRGQIDVPITIEGEDEISTLAQSYNVMLSDLQQHIKRLSESKLAEQQAVLFSLQSQIDSHFLYNTLEIINSMATQIRHYEIESITISLAHMFRYTANYRHTDVTVRDEVQHLKRYLQIIQIRYGDAFDYTLQVDEACLDTPCLKVILQPIAENAVRHGFEKNVKQLSLSIVVQRTEQGTLGVIVTDNGAGFTEQRLQDLRDQLAHAESDYTDFQRIGLLNIQYRLRMRYHAAGPGIEIGNSPQGGAFVHMQFPL